MADNDKFDPTKPVQRRDGMTARIICTDRNSREGYSDFPIVALVGKYENILCYMHDGKSKRDSIMPSDLVNIHVRHERWLNIYKDGYEFLPYHTKDEADFHASRSSEDRIACIKISFEEGEGLD